jgi:DNA-binding transcriptional MerR regulator
VPAELTIEQLASASGMSVRNIRAHQARGLLAAPEVRRRVGYYGPDHVAQLKLITDLQADGFNLAGIKRLLQDTQATTERLSRFRQALAATPGAETPVTQTLAERVVARGVSLDGALEVLEQIERHCDAVSAAFVRLFMEQVWQPFEQAGMPEARWAEMDASIKALRPLAGDALQAILELRMDVQIDAAFGELTRRLDDAGH